MFAGLSGHLGVDQVLLISFSMTFGFGSGITDLFVTFDFSGCIVDFFNFFCTYWYGLGVTVGIPLILFFVVSVADLGFGVFCLVILVLLFQ